MAIYVDKPVEGNHPSTLLNDPWLHMWADDEELNELHEFANKLGISNNSFCNHHEIAYYMISPPMRDLAIKYGAKEMSMEEWYNKNRKDKVAR